MAVQPVPEGMQTVTPYLIVPGVARLIEFLKVAFGAKETGRFDMPDGTVMHAEVRIGDSNVMMGDAGGPHAPQPAHLHLAVPDVDVVYARALKAGATSVREPANQFYGDRSGGVKDPGGNTWWISTHIEDLSMEEIARRGKAARKG